MKKQLSLIMAGGLLAFASCNSGTTPENGASQATIDSTVNARVEQIRTEMMAKNDSIINAMAQMKADSMMAAMKGGAKPAAKPVAKAKHSTTTTANTTPAVAAQPATPTSGSKWNQGETGTNSKSKWNKEENKTEPTSKSKWGGK
jgi:hypothetical protein